jgi:hypothetical protein
MSNFNFPLDKSMPKVQIAWYSAVGKLCNALTGAGTTANRPTVGLYVGRPYLDTTLGIPIWYDGSQWIDATGAPA